MQRSHSMSLSHHHHHQQEDQELASSFSPSYANQLHHHHSLIISNGGCSSPSVTTTPIQRSISVAAGVDSLPIKSLHHHHHTYNQHEAVHAQQLLIHDDGKLKLLQPGPKIVKPEQTVHLIPLVLLLCALVLWLGTPASEFNDPVLVSKLTEPPPKMMVGESTATQQAMQNARQALSSVQSSTRRIQIHSAIGNLRGESRS